MAIYRCAACGGVNHATADAGAPADACTRCRRPLDRSGQPQDVDAAALVSAIRSSPAPVLVDFSDAPSVALDGVARACAGELVVLRVHPSSEPAAASTSCGWPLRSSGRRQRVQASAGAPASAVAWFTPPQAAQR